MGKMDKEEREAIINKLREDYLVNKRVFEQNKHLLTNEEFKLQRVLLKLEESIYLNTPRPSLAEMYENFEEQLLLGQNCCGVGFNSYFDWNNHLKMHHDEERMKQKNIICEKETDNSIQQKKVFNCTIFGCTKTYSSAYGLKYHSVNGHKFDENWFKKPFFCPIILCKKRYKNQNGLKYHLENNH